MSNANAGNSIRIKGSRRGMTFVAAMALAFLGLEPITLHAQTIITVAGGGPNNVPALRAGIGPQTVAVDGSGNIYITDGGLNRVFKVTPGGQLTVVAGNGAPLAGGVPVFSGDGGPATSASLAAPFGVFVDGAGNIFIADTFNNRIREVFGPNPPAGQTAGNIQTIVGNGTATFGGDGGPATSASLNAPTGVFVDGAGNIFISDNSNNRIREVVKATGNIQTVAGNGTAAFAGDGGPATSASLNNADGIFVDGAGNIFIADSGNNRVREVVAATGSIQTVAGNGSLGSGGDGGPATSASLVLPTGVFGDTTGNLFITDTGHKIREVVKTTGIIRTIAGTGSFGFSGDGGPATSAQVNLPEGIFIDTAGNIFFADLGNLRLREVFGPNPPSGQTAGNIITVAGNGTPDGDGDLATIASLNLPSTAFVDSAGNIFIADPGIDRVREVVKATGNIQTVAGEAFGFVCPAATDPLGDGCPATNAPLSSPAAAFVDAAGNIFIADNGNNRIREVIKATGIIQTVAGGGTSPSTCAGSTNAIGDGCLATSASLLQPTCMFVDSAGNIFIADAANSRIREVVKATGIIRTVAGTGSVGFSGDGGAATSASLNNPMSLSLDSSQNIFVADTGNNRIREIVAATGIIQTVAGNGNAAFTGDGGPATSASLGLPFGVFVDASGNILIADTGNERIREVAKATGNIQTVAGGGGAPDTCAGSTNTIGDGCLATSASLRSPTAVVTDSSGNLFVADESHSRIRAVVVSAPSPSFLPNSLAFSNQSVGTSSAAQTITLTNSGNATLSITSIQITGANGGDFSQANTCGASLAAGANCTINVTFTPAAGGSRAASVTITDNAINSPQSVSLTGTGVAAAPSVTLAPTSLTFTSQGVGTTSAAQATTVTNGGNAALSITSIAVTGANGGDFSQTNTCGASVAAGANCTINVTFKPTATGARTASVTITDNAGNSPQSVGLTGTAVATAPSVTLAPTSLTFASQTVGTQTGTPQSVTLTNSGNAALTITSIAVTGTNSGDFPQTNTCGTSVTAGASCTISVSFRPAAGGARTASVTITDNAGNSPQSISLTGTGADFAVAVAQGGSTTATITAGQTATYALQINAIGAQQTVSLTCTGAPATATCTVPASVSATPGTPAAVNVSVSTTARGVFIPLPRWVRWRTPSKPVPFVWLVSLLGLLLCTLGRRAYRRSGLRPAWTARLAFAMPVLLLVLSMAVMTGCAGGTSSTPPAPTGTPQGTSTITVTATSNGVTHTQQLTLTVQ